MSGFSSSSVVPEEDPPPLSCLPLVLAYAWTPFLSAVFLSHTYSFLNLSLQLALNCPPPHSAFKSSAVSSFTAFLVLSSLLCYFIYHFCGLGQHTHTLSPSHSHHLTIWKPEDHWLRSSSSGLTVWHVKEARQMSHHLNRSLTHHVQILFVDQMFTFHTGRKSVTTGFHGYSNPFITKTVGHLRGKSGR